MLKMFDISSNDNIFYFCLCLLCYVKNNFNYVSNVKIKNYVRSKFI